MSLLLLVMASVATSSPAVYYNYPGTLQLSPIYLGTAPVYRSQIRYLPNPTNIKNGYYGDINTDVIQKSKNLVDSLRPSLNALSSPFNGNFGSQSTNSNFDTLRQTRNLVNSLTPSLKALASDPSSAAIANKFIKDNYIACVSSLDDGIASLEAATQQVERVEPEIAALTDKINSFILLRDPVQIIRETGALLRLLQPLADKTKFYNPNKCQAAAPAAPAGGFQSLGGNNALATFLSQLKSTTARLQSFCLNGDFNRDSITAIGDIMDILADLYVSLGDAQTGRKIRDGKLFTERITVGDIIMTNFL